MSASVVPPDGVVPDKDQLTDVAGVGLAVGVDSLVAREVVRSEEGFVTLGAGMSPHLRVSIEVGVEVILAEETFWADGTLEPAFALVIFLLGGGGGDFVVVMVIVVLIFVAITVIKVLAALGV